jgi:hypothetical protein
MLLVAALPSCSASSYYISSDMSLSCDSFVLSSCLSIDSRLSIVCVSS